MPFFLIYNRYSDKAASIPNHWHPITVKGEIGVKVCKNFLCHNHSGGFCLILSKKYGVCSKDFRVSGLGQVRRLTAATAAVTLAHLIVEMLCYVLGRLHSSCVLSTRIGLHRIEVINKTLVNGDFSKKNLNFLFIHV